MNRELLEICEKKLSYFANYYTSDINDLIKDIQAELAKPNPNIIGWVNLDYVKRANELVIEKNRNTAFMAHIMPNDEYTTPLYANQSAQQKPLSDDEINKIVLSIRPWSGLQFARAIEKAHGIK